MSLWQITKNGPKKVKETKLKSEKILERNLEDWIANQPELLQEPLLLIGRQVLIPDIGDKIDLLALDLQGNTVIIELKRGKLTDPVDMQALRYASYISRWSFEDFESRARNFHNQKEEMQLNELFEQFCYDEGIDEVPDINTDQRLIIVGAEIKEKLGSVALWLREHSIDITVIEFEAFKETEEDFLIQPKVIIPQPVNRFSDIGTATPGESIKPWVKNGRKWHLEKRCSEQTKKLLNQLNDFLSENLELEGPRWNQKLYVAYRVKNYNWLIIKTRKNALAMMFHIQSGIFSEEELAKRLDVEVFNKEDSRSEKLGLSSSLTIEKRNKSTDRVILRIKEDFNIDSESFQEFIQDMYNAYPE